MGEILDTAVNFFIQDDWPFTQTNGQPVLQLAFHGDSGTWTCLFQAREEQAQCIFYSVCPVNAPDHKRMAMAEFLTRVNYSTVIGNFEMDLSDGEVRYKTSIDVQDDHLSSNLVRNLIYTNVVIMDRYLPAIMNVIYGNVPPAEAIAKIEDAEARP
jgi:hypothetical protein